MKVVVFTEFRQIAERLYKRYHNKYRTFLVHGGLSLQDRHNCILAFQSENESAVLFSTDSLAYGVELSQAEIIIHYTQPWNPALLRQREDRLHRIGQKSSVQVINLLARRTIDEHVRAILHRKRELAATILDEEYTEAQTGLTKSDILALLGEKE